MGFAFHRPESLDAAIAIVREHSETARLLAGGTDPHHPDQPAADPAGASGRPGCLGLDSIDETDREVVLGAMATHDAVVTVPASGSSSLR